jgi:hypothetical protein
MNVQNKLLAVMGLVFVAVISAPMLASIFQADKAVSETEKRTLQTWPVYADSESLPTYFSSINSYVNDHFGFREDLIKLNNKIKYSLNESPSKRVIRGRGDWLFLKIHDPLMSNQKTPKSTVKANVLKRANYIRGMSQELTKKDIAYQHIVAPNKMNVYPEHLPALYGLTDINATYDLFRENVSGLEEAVVFNAIDALRVNKSNEYGADLYFKNDTHWNPLGAYHVYRESLTRLKQDYPHLDLALKPHLFEVHRKQSGDLAVMAGLSSSLIAEEPQTSFEACTVRSKIKSIRKNMSLSTCNANETTMLLIADSFMTGIYPYMSQSVGDLYMIGQRASRSEIRKAIEEIKPDVVVEIIVERSLARYLP